MRDLSSRLKNRVINYSDLIRYGFNKNEERYVYMQNIYNNQFKVIVEIKNDKMISKLINLINEDEYILVDIQDSVGEFVGKVRQEYEKKLKDIIKNI